MDEEDRLQTITVYDFYFNIIKQTSKLCKIYYIVQFMQFNLYSNSTFGTLFIDCMTRININNTLIFLLNLDTQYLQLSCSDTLAIGN